MVYECEHCGYSTNRFQNFDRHKNRKNPCHKIINDEDYINNIEIIYSQKSEYNSQKSEYDSQKSEYDSQKSEVFCQKCKKNFSNKYNLYRHSLICKGVDNLTCFKCKKIFNTISSKNKHVKNNKCTYDNSNMNIQNNTSIETQNNIHNTSIETQNNIENQNNININIFGKEDLSYLMNEDGFIDRIKQFGKNGIYGLAKIISDVHCNNKKLENNNIIKPEEYAKHSHLVQRCEFGDGVYIMGDDKEWEFREFEDIKDDMINTISKYIKYYNDRRNNHNVKYSDKREKHFVRNLFYFALALECNVPEDLFEDLEMDEENVEEDENELKNMNRKFDKATMRKLHENTHFRYKRENGKYVKKK
jgi:hypothetical protein